MVNEKLKVSLTSVLFMTVVFTAIYWYVSDGQEEQKERIAMVQQDYKYGKGVITKMFNYKGHSVYVSYKINGVAYEYSGGWDDSKGLSTGDSIKFKYAINNPSMIITELENEYKEK
jgi:hypothetical protein